MSAKKATKNKTVKVVEKEPLDSPKYKLALKFVNKILVNIGKDEVDDLTKFVNIDREDIIKEVNRKSLEEMEGELLKLFDKKKLGLYRRTDTIALNCLRGMMKEIGYKLIKEQKDITSTIDGQNYRKTHMIYHIK